jgi:hypothetical protein
MADYYPLISRAVAGLEKNNGENRRSVYERARAALIAQLRGVTPALPEGDITRERLALEEAIRKVEAEAARAFAQASSRSRDQERWDDTPRTPPRQTASTPLRSERSDARADMPPRRAAPVAAPAMPRQSDTIFDQPMSERERAPEPPPVAPPAPARHPLRRPLAERRSTAEAGVNDFRSVVSEANELGGASARANQSARDAYAAVPAPVDYDRREPRMYDQRGDVREAAGEGDGRELHTLPAFEQPLLEPSYADDARPLPPRTRHQQAAADEELADERELRPKRSYADLIKGAGVVAVVACLGGALLWQWPNLMSFYQRIRGPAVDVEATTRNPSNANSRVKIPDRVESGAPASQTPAAVTPGATAAVAQKVVLYEEDPNIPEGRRFVGSAIWRTETVTPGPGQPPELAVRVDIDVPERKLAMTVSLRRNTDKNLPASHTVEIMFKTPADFPSGGISNVPGILMKQAEQTRGVPLAGLAVKVTNGFFLIGLSSADADKERNLQLLKERAWFDIPVVYANNRRAILAVEKGTPGDRVFAEAFKVWKQ